MEASSPLAAMQPPAALPGHCYFNKYGPNSFNFRDLSMKKSQPDYVNMKPMRGSSPTASLAADLSQNFTIDQSPQLPTPRRQIFAGAFFGGLNGRGNLTTPPLPSSSPGPSSDSMDISPLPHKHPFHSNFESQLQSPTPDLIPADASFSTASPSLDTPLETVRMILPPERKKVGPLRPSLSRVKGLSTSSVPHNLPSESKPPPFRFGNGVSKLTTSSSMTLSEIFLESPSHERSPLAAPVVMGPPRPRQPLAGLTTNMRTGSPCSGHIRKTSNPLVRPRKQYRRSLSMFEHPEDVMSQDKPSNVPSLPSIMDVEVSHTLKLPHFVPDGQAGDLPRITKETLVKVMDGTFNHHYEKLVIIDCRFEYEYSGGHIDKAVNFNDKEQLASRLFDIEPTPKALLVFHCEYSAHRAPIMAKFIRNKDRTINAERYPRLTYPELYILDGGYSSFFKDYRPRCFPPNYVEMQAKEHAIACERALGKVKQRSKLVRAQTYAFGQHSPAEHSSPTAQCRAGPDLNVDMDLGSDMGSLGAYGQQFETNRQPPQRMSSY